MGRGLLQAHLEAFDRVGAGVADERREGYDRQYEYSDAIKGAHGVFFFQHPPMLEYQERLKQKKERCNAETIPKARRIPSANHLTRLVDNITPRDFAGVFSEGLHTAAKYGGLDRYLVLGKHRLVALGGVWLCQSRNTNRAHCLHHTANDGETLHYHDMVAAALVKGGEETALPLNPEFVRNEDGQGKQGCERNAVRRRLERNAESYKWLNPVLLGDGIYADYPACAVVAGKGLRFLFARRPDSHQWLHDSPDDGCLERRTVRARAGRQHLVHRCRWCNGVEIRGEQPTPAVNHLPLEIWNGEKGKVTYRSSWVTDLATDDTNVAEMAACARARWKIENEHHNVLKHHGCHLEHNFGHGQEHACGIYAVVNLPAFQMRGVMLLLDEGHQKARKSIRRRDEFFAGLRVFSNRYLFENWDAFIGFVGQDDDPGG